MKPLFGAGSSPITLSTYYFIMPKKAYATGLKTRTYAFIFFVIYYLFLKGLIFMHMADALISPTVGAAMYAASAATAGISIYRLRSEDRLRPELTSKRLPPWL